MNPTVTIHGANGITAVWEILPDGTQRLLRQHPTPPSPLLPDGRYPEAAVAAKSNLSPADQQTLDALAARTE